MLANMQLLFKRIWYIIDFYFIPMILNYIKNKYEVIPLNTVNILLFFCLFVDSLNV